MVGWRGRGRGRHGVAGLRRWGPPSWKAAAAAAAHGGGGNVIVVACQQLLQNEDAGTRPTTRSRPRCRRDRRHRGLAPTSAPAGRPVPAPTAAAGAGRGGADRRRGRRGERRASRPGLAIGAAPGAASLPDIGPKTPAAVAPRSRQGIWGSRKSINSSPPVCPEFQMFHYACSSLSINRRDMRISAIMHNGDEALPVCDRFPRNPRASSHPAMATTAMLKRLIDERPEREAAQAAPRPTRKRAVTHARSRCACCGAARGRRRRRRRRPCSHVAPRIARASTSRSAGAGGEHGSATRQGVGRGREAGGSAREVTTQPARRVGGARGRAPRHRAPPRRGEDAA